MVILRVFEWSTTDVCVRYMIVLRSDKAVKVILHYYSITTHYYPCLIYRMALQFHLKNNARLTLAS